MLTNDYSWLTGRELLLNELGTRLAEIRDRLTTDRSAQALSIGLVVYMECRMARMKDALAALPSLSYPASEVGQQLLDRMVSALVTTLLHAESSLGAVVERPRRIVQRRAARSLDAECTA
jgi:hypothetical protein